MSQAFDSLLAKIENYYSDADYTVQDAEHLSRIAISEYASTQNALVASARQLSAGSVQKIIDLTIDKHITADPSEWMLFAANAVDNVINYSQRGVLASGLSDFTDFLPVGHPSRTNRGAMTASALNQATALWTAADPRIASDEARYDTYKAYSSQPGSVEADYAAYKLSALVAAGYVPEDISLPITAAFRMSFAMRSAMSKALAAVRRRHRDGRFAEEFGRLKGFFSRGDGSIFSENGRIVGAERGTNNFEVEFSGSDEIPDGIYSIDAAKTDSVKAVLSKRALKGVKGKRSIAVPTQAERDAAIPLDEFLKTKKDAPEGWTKNEDGSFTSKTGQTLRQVDTRPEGDYMFEGAGESGAEDPNEPFFQLTDRDGETIGVAQDWAGANKIALTYDAFEEDSKPEEDGPGFDQDAPSAEEFRTPDAEIEKAREAASKFAEEGFVEDKINYLRGKPDVEFMIPLDPSDPEARLSVRWSKREGKWYAGAVMQSDRGTTDFSDNGDLGSFDTPEEAMDAAVAFKNDDDRMEAYNDERADARTRINEEIQNEVESAIGRGDKNQLEEYIADSDYAEYHDQIDDALTDIESAEGVEEDEEGFDQDVPQSESIDIKHASTKANWRRGEYTSPDGRLEVALEGDVDGNYVDAKLDGKDLDIGDPEYLQSLLEQVTNYPDNRMTPSQVQENLDEIAKMLDEDVRAADASASDIGPDLERTDSGDLEYFSDTAGADISKVGDKWRLVKSGFEDIEEHPRGVYEYEETKMFDSEQEAIAEAQKWIDLGKSSDFYSFMYNDWFDGQADGLDQDAKNPNWFEDAIDFDAMDNQDNWKDIGGGAQQYTSPDGKLKLTFEPDGDGDGAGGIVDASGILVEYDGQPVTSFRATERDITSPGVIADSVSVALGDANFNPNDLVKGDGLGEYEFIPASDVGSVSIVKKYDPNTKKLQWEVTKEARDLIDENIEHSYFEQKKFDSLDEARADAEAFAQILNDDNKFSKFLNDDWADRDYDYGFDQADPSAPNSVKQLADGYNISPRVELSYNRNTNQYERSVNPNEFEADGDFYDFGQAVVTLSEYAPGKWVATIFYGDNDGSGQNVLELEQTFDSPEDAFEWTANGFNKQFDNSQVAEGVIERNSSVEMLDFLNSPKFKEVDESYQEEISARLSSLGFDQDASADEIKTSEGGNASYKGSDGSTGSIKSDGSGTWEGSFTDAEGESFTRKFKAEDKAAAWLQKKVDDSKLAAFKKANDGLSPKQLEPATPKQYDLLQELFDERDEIDSLTSDAIKDALDNRNLSKSQISALFGDLQKKPFKPGVDSTKPTDRMLNSLQGYLTTKQISPEELDDILSQLEAGLDRPGIEALTNKLRRKPDNADAVGLDQDVPTPSNEESLSARWNDMSEDEKAETIESVSDYIGEWAESNPAEFYTNWARFALDSYYNPDGVRAFEKPYDYAENYLDYLSANDPEMIDVISRELNGPGLDQDAPTKPLSEKQLEPASDAQYNYLQSLVESKMDVDSDTAAAVAEAAINKNLTKAQAGALIGKLRPLADKENAGQFGKPSQKMIDSVNRDVYAKGLSEEDRNEILKDLNNLSKGDVSSIISQLKEMPNVPGGLDNYIKKLVEDGNLEALKGLKADVRNEDSFSVLDRAINSLETGEDAGLDQATPSTQESGPLFDKDEVSNLLEEIREAEESGEIGNNFVSPGLVDDLDPESVGDAAMLYDELNDITNVGSSGTLGEKIAEITKKLLESIKSKLGPVEFAKRDSDDLGSSSKFDSAVDELNDFLAYYYPTEASSDMAVGPEGGSVGDVRGGGWEASVRFNEETEKWEADLTSPGQDSESYSQEFDDQEDAAEYATNELEKNNYESVDVNVLLLSRDGLDSLVSEYGDNPEELNVALASVIGWLTNTNRGQADNIAAILDEVAERLGEASAASPKA